MVTQQRPQVDVLLHLTISPQKDEQLQRGGSWWCLPTMRPQSLFERPTGSSSEGESAAMHDIEQFLTKYARISALLLCMIAVYHGVATYAQV